MGAALLLYAITGLAAVRLTATRGQEPWLGPIVGLATGLIAAATGVFVIPAVPYLQAVGLEKEELVQALGLSFTVSTLALTFNLAFIGALAMACAGMCAGQVLRLRMHPVTFRRWFFVGLLLLGVYLVVHSAI